MAVQHIHIIGIGGSGASGVARYLQTLGFIVSGSDTNRARVAALKNGGIKVFDQHRAENISRPDLVLFSPGVYAAEHEFAAAKQKEIPVLPWQEFIGRYLDRRPGRGFMVAGTYGKGSTAAILAHILEAAYLDPLAILGVEDIAWGSNIRPGLGEGWVLEADEYNRHFLNFHPHYAGITSLEHEHLATYPTFDDYVAAFAQFVAGLREPKAVVVKHGLPTNRLVPAGTAVTTYGLDRGATVQGRIIESTIDGSRFTISAPTRDVSEQELRLAVPGRLHVENAVGAAALALVAGVGISAVNAGLAQFKGLRRRFEVVHSGSYVTIFDFGNLPKRIGNVIAETRSLFPGRRVVVLFEPHLYSRTKQHLAEFKAVLATADRAYVTDIFPSREANSQLAATVHSRALIDGVPERVSYVGTLEQGLITVAQARTERDVVLVLGSGPIQSAAGRLVG